MTRFGTTLLALALLPAPAAFGQTNSQEGEASQDEEVAPPLDQADWLVRTARIEGAAGNVKEAAGAVAETATAIAEGGRLDHLAELLGRAHQLDRRIISTRLAGEVLDEP